MAILGGGYVGLWTALEIKRREPSCAVVLSRFAPSGLEDKASDSDRQVVKV